MPGGPFVENVPIPAPLRGLIDGLDPAIEEFPAAAAADLENFRVGRGTWETRLGHVLWKTIPGSGDVRLLGDLYEASGNRVRLAARGTGAAAQFYHLLEGTDTVFQSSSGGGSLGGTSFLHFQGVVVRDRFYFTDRAGALRRFQRAPASGNQVIAVAGPAKPSVAPRVRARPWGVLTDFSTIGTTWAQSDTSKYELTDVTATAGSPQGRTAQVTIKSTSGLNQTISEDVPSQSVPSHTIAFWVIQNVAKNYNQFGFGIDAPDEFVYQIKATSDDEWYPVFIPIGDIGQISYKRFRCVRAPGLTSMLVSSIMLPGRLEGAYRWVYTHYNSTSGQESAPSPISGGGVATDLTAVGVTNNRETQRAFSKSAVLDFTSDSGTDATTDKVRFYRNGGVAELTKDSSGRDLWLKVAEVNDISTTLSGGISAGSGFATAALLLTNSVGFAAGDTVVIEKGVAGKEEYVTLDLFFGGGWFVKDPAGVKNAHLAGAAVQMAFLDNVANEMIDTTQAIQIERDDPPSGAHFVVRTPEGRLVLAGFPNDPTLICFSNRPTPDRRQDYEIFPDNVDPLTRHDLNQGWRCRIGGDFTDEEVMWAGIFRGLLHVLTRRNLYRIDATSQADWGPQAIVPLASTGCIARDTIAEVNGTLYWVAPGPQVMRYDGRGTPQDVSYPIASARLTAAPTANWDNWLAVAHSKRDGHYYCLYLTPQGLTTNSLRLDFRQDQNGDVVEPQVYRNSLGAVLGFAGVSIRFGSSDVQDLYHAATDGSVYQTESGTTDDGAAIVVRALTRRFPLGVTGQLHTFFLRGAAVTDTLTITAYAGGSEYGDHSAAYAVSMAGTGDHEEKRRIDRGTKGRWAQFGIAGSVLNRPIIRDLLFWFLPIRSGRYHP